MSTRVDVLNGRLVYTCNCGWVDTSHSSDPGRRQFVGPRSLWQQVRDETGRRSIRKDPPGYSVTYRQDMGRIIKGYALTVGTQNAYFVKAGISVREKESVALAIFQEISVRFEEFQKWAFWNDSSFSQEDLVSDLIGFYYAVRPGPDYLGLCHPVGKDESLKVWDTYGSVGSTKNRTFRPMFHPCEACKKVGSEFPKALQAITPAKAGESYREWDIHDDFTPEEWARIQAMSGPKF